MSKSSIVVARENFLAEIDGEYFDVFGGDLFEADHPLPKKHPQLFNEPVFRYPTRPEAKPRQATASEEKAIAATVEAETPKPLTTSSLRPSH